MNFAVLLKDSLPVWLLVFSGFTFAFGMTYMTIPAIVRVARLKNLCAIPNMRTSHINATPNLGGVALFLGFIISILIIAGMYFTSELLYILSGLIIMFYVGMKDDILIIDPKKKLAAQVIVAFMIAIFADIRITDFSVIFSFKANSYIISVVSTVFLFLVLINGFNLIDGIDGLAAGTGILGAIFFGAWFWNAGDISYSLFCFSLAGSLSAFFIFNVFGKKNKIFMGDTGSLITGLSMSIIVVHFLNPAQGPTISPHIIPSPALAMGILILPVFDTLRIFVIRIYQHKSPFIADHQHIHHRLLDLGFSHLKSTIILLAVNAFFIALCILFQKMHILLLILMMFSAATIMSYVLLKLALRHASKPDAVFYRMESAGEIRSNEKFVAEQGNVEVTQHEMEAVSR